MGGGMSYFLKPFAHGFYLNESQYVNRYMTFAVVSRLHCLETLCKFKYTFTHLRT